MAVAGLNMSQHVGERCPVRGVCPRTEIPVQCRIGPRITVVGGN